MVSHASARRLGGAIALCAAIGLCLHPGPAAAEATPPSCGAWEVEYALSGNLKLTDTPLGQGDGIYPVGPGNLVLRFEDVDGQPAGHVKLLSYSMKQAVTVVASALFFKATVVSNTVTHATPNSCGVSAEGLLRGSSLAWSGSVRAFRSDGMLNCDGSLCGKFGAPPAGQSPLHIGPNAVQFQPFQFSPDFKTFTMASTFVAKTDDPKQTSYLALSGREMKRSCVEVKACP